MRQICILALLVMAILVPGSSATGVPNLLGNWTGMESWYGAVDGSARLTENESINMAVTDQNGRLFAGHLTFKSANGTEIIEGFSGAIGQDNKSIYISEFNEGYDLGTIISEDEIELVYLVDGKMAETTLSTLHRIGA
jgi:hypothetical protein